MAVQHDPDALASLRAELAAQRALTETLRADLDLLHRQPPTARRPLRRLLPLGIVGLLVALLPLSLLAANPFGDLNTGSVHNPNIDAIYNAGITTGCDPGVSYCPNGNVTREEMASFLARTAGIGTNKPVANAARLAATNPIAGGPTYAANELVRVARGTGNTTALNTTYQPIATATITAPAAGFVLVNGVVDIQTAGGSTCYAQTRLRDATGNVATPTYFTYLGSGEAQLASPAYLFQVNAGVQTLELQASLQQAGCTASGYNPAISVLYVPFGSTGGTTLDLPEAPATAPHSGPGNE